VKIRAEAELTLLQKLKILQTFWKEREFHLGKFFFLVRSQESILDRSHRPPSGRFRKLEEQVLVKDSGTFILM
ncbi:Hypothetical predicted protein, partial [Pelobates cultripes]